MKIIKIRIVFTSPPGNNEILPKNETPFSEKICGLFKAKLRLILQEGNEEGLFEIADIELTLSALMFMAEFIRIRWILHHTEQECDAIVDEMNRIILSGLSKR